MHCTKCGVEVGPDDKFCKKCGQAVLKEADKKEDGPVLASGKQQPSGCAQSCGWTVIVLLFLIYLFALLIEYGKIKSSAGLIVAFCLMGAFFVLIFGWAIFRPRKNKKSGKDTHTRPKGDHVTAVVTSVIAIIVIIPIALIMIYAFRRHDVTPTPTPTPTSTSKPKPTSSNSATTQPTSYDGNYDAQMSKPNCDSSVEITSFQVANNEVINTYGNGAPIDSAGHATLTYDTSTSMTVNFSFTSGGASGTWSTSKGCSGTFSANKTW